ncbi:Hypothetical protein GbCGDNIH9_0918 [Granulibacter bethesdensis]|uniref:Uncharacterized protein n=1 Tax=Granulibacter bethesdensis TaxID=364410 RepID=A0AAC9KAK6_9PROT|nr:Hypothetical protein GbCGDNIH9_0918 [Granulibacter bethesdensis]APH61756.1 Hypothetical protein GbCGDNIH8_8454 [Granulibacter bethesdensis]
MVHPGRRFCILSASGDYSDCTGAGIVQAGPSGCTTASGAGSERTACRQCPDGYDRPCCQTARTGHDQRTRGPAATGAFFHCRCHHLRHFSDRGLADRSQSGSPGCRTIPQHTDAMACHYCQSRTPFALVFISYRPGRLRCLVCDCLSGPAIADYPVAARSLRPVILRRGDCCLRCRQRAWHDDRGQPSHSRPSCLHDVRRHGTGRSRSRLHDIGGFTGTPSLDSSRSDDLCRHSRYGRAVRGYSHCHPASDHTERSGRSRFGPWFSDQL